MKELIRQHAMELGFDACHFTSALVPDHATQLQEWLDQGRHGEMQYLAKNAFKRVDPQQVLPGARTIIVLATSYYSAKHTQGRQGTSTSENNPKQSFPTQPGDLPTVGAVEPTPTHLDLPAQERALGQIARYAQYDDYHDVLADKLNELTNFVTSLAPGPSRGLWYVDTGPLLERDLAMRAGLGFIGKHTNLIGRKLGNWFFLSEIITTIEIEPDPPEHNRCGSCTRCISACPTGAILQPFQLDARKCISYLTIELKGSIPIEYRKAIGNRVYGCDDCLNACPWNRFAREGSIMKAHGRNDLDQPTLVDFLSLDQPTFKRKFAGSPILRTKRRGFLRNVCVALGNIGDETALPALHKATADPEPLIAEHANWAMEQIELRSRLTPSKSSSGTLP